MSRTGHHHDPKHQHHPRAAGLINERTTSGMFVLASVVTCLAGVATWLYQTSRIGTPAFAFALAVMVIAFVGALIFLSVICIKHAVKRSEDRILKKIDKRIEKACDKIDERMETCSGKVESSVRASIRNGELGAYIDAVTPRQQPRLYPVENT